MNAISKHNIAIAARHTIGQTITARIGQMMALSRQRRALAKLDAHLLSDIGVTRSEATAESKKPIWDSPCHWIR